MSETQETINLSDPAYADVNLVKMLTVDIAERFFSGAGALYHLLRHHGQEFRYQEVPERLNKRMGKWRHGQPKNCYMDAQNLALHVKGARYFEGFFASRNFPAALVHHAWVVLDGEMVDITFSACSVSLGNRMDHEYFGLELPQEDVRRNQLDQKSFWPLTDFPGKYMQGRLCEMLAAVEPDFDAQTHRWKERT